MRAQIKANLPASKYRESDSGGAVQLTLEAYDRWQTFNRMVGVGVYEARVVSVPDAEMECMRFVRRLIVKVGSLWLMPRITDPSQFKILNTTRRKSKPRRKRRR